MQFIRYYRGTQKWGLVQNDEVYPLAPTSEGEPSFEQLANESYRNKICREVNSGAVSTTSRDSIRPLAPISTPGKIICVGLNYHDHAEEQDEEPPKRPVLFGKAPTAVTNPEDPIVLPPGVEQVDYEVELAIVIGRVARNVSASEAREYIAGYTILNDVSARDAQFEDGQYFRGKSYDTFAPMGPILLSASGVDANDLGLSLSVNGITKQDSSTAEFVFDIEKLIEYISGVMTLRPGDVISTGTPGGVGVFQDPPELLESGDSVDARVENIGTLSNPVIER